ncbi:tRNA lysidine(34) synthetase TilS [Ramlibacter sp.]|uniref:tRNA lysidine(34) synthetase TilS n=1 Tax=Ramlibacter sp. TaxID=1917967 RepID=UPI003D13B351
MSPDLRTAMEQAAPPLPLAVAFSGGADSTCLLHAAVRSWPGQVQALHVHHGLQAAADDFLAHCRRACDRLAVPLHVARLDASHARGESPEDAARQARYLALADLAIRHGVRTVLLAQHADDQVETMLLALSRGAGLPGLAAMPASFERHGMRFERPLLAVPARAIREWLAVEGIEFVDDPTNADTRFTRNRIRHALMPALEAAFPSFRDTFARSARHAAQAQQVLRSVAEDDLRALDGRMSIDGLQRLPRERQANVLRHWLRSAHAASPSEAQLAELLDQVAACVTRGHSIRIAVASGRVEREGAVLRFVVPAPSRE